MAPDPTVDALIDEGDKSLEAGEYERALQLFDQALQADPEHWGAALGRIEILQMLWRTDEALRDDRGGLPRDPGQGSGVAPRGDPLRGRAGSRPRRVQADGRDRGARPPHHAGGPRALRGHDRGREGRRSVRVSERRALLSTESRAGGAVPLGGGEGDQDHAAPRIRPLPGIRRRGAGAPGARMMRSADEMSERSIAIIGGGPIGIEAALEAKRRGFDVTVYEADRVGGHLLRFCHVGLFTPFAMNSTEAGREALRAAGVAVPRYDDLLTASELVGRYLSPLAGLPELRSSIREGERVTHVGREGFAKGQGIAGTGDGSREGAPFLIRVEGPDRLTRLDRADVVIDASGVYANPNATGPGGLPALGEDRVSDRIDRWIPAVRGEAMDRYRGRTILLIGDGHSAATFLTEMGALAEERGWDSGIEIHWVHRE